MLRKTIAMVFGGLFLVCASGEAGAGNVMYFTSTPGSWIGQGQTLTMTNVSVYRYYSQGAYTNAVQFDAGATPGYSLDLVEPNYSVPTVGFYDNVTRWPFMNNGAGMAFTAPGRGDNNLTGWFNVLQADYNPDGSVAAFAVDFKQYDELSTTNWTQGSIRYNSSIALAPEPSPAVALLAAGFLLLMQRPRTVFPNTKRAPYPR